jgi:alkylation response protein AidB-like acyl-CoA dehydrogenase
MTQTSEQFRAEVRAFLDEVLPPELRFTVHRLEMMSKASAKNWQATLAQRGWSVPHWPVEYGGTDWSDAQHQIFIEECVSAGAPLASGFGNSMIGPILIARGTEAQKREHLPPIVSGKRLWCQGYSEPGAGSDLAALRTRAVRDGDHYVVDGQKLWTTQAHWADWMFCLVRTDASGRPQQGITFLLIDMITPGIEIRPIRSIDGLHHLNEVFFDNVRVPLANRIGEEGEGWQVAKELLGHERQSIAKVAASRVELARLKLWAGPDGGFRKPPLAEPAIATKFAELEGRLDALAALESALADGGGHPGRGAGSLKLLGTELAQDIAELGVCLAGPEALPMPDGSGIAVSCNGIAGEQVTANYLFARAHTIYGGTSEVQRNLIARTVHG